MKVKSKAPPKRTISFKVRDKDAPGIKKHVRKLLINKGYILYDKK